MSTASNQPEAKTSLVNGTYPSALAGQDRGTPFREGVNINRATLIGIRVRHGWKLDSVQGIYSFEGTQFNGPQNGGNGGIEDIFWLNNGEYIVAIGGRANFEVDGIRFFTNKGRQSLYYGGAGGNLFGGLEFAINPRYPHSGLQYFNGTIGQSDTTTPTVFSIRAIWAENVPIGR